MKPMNSEQILINTKEREKIHLFFNCIKASKALYYLEKEDIINLSKCSKFSNSYIENNNLLFLNLIHSNQTL